jgi:hypothetical protein
MPAVGVRPRARGCSQRDYYSTTCNAGLRRAPVNFIFLRWLFAFSMLLSALNILCMNAAELELDGTSSIASTSSAQSLIRFLSLSSCFIHLPLSVSSRLDYFPSIKNRRRGLGRKLGPVSRSLGAVEGTTPHEGHNQMFDVAHSTRHRRKQCADDARPASTGAV